MSRQGRTDGVTLYGRFGVTLYGRVGGRKARGLVSPARVEPSAVRVVGFDSSFAVY
eukprot:SAG11_NODE_37074_length_258_cov_1.276730_1_plen_55_part_10